MTREVHRALMQGCSVACAVRWRPIAFWEQRKVPVWRNAGDSSWRRGGHPVVPLKGPLRVKAGSDEVKMIG